MDSFLNNRSKHKLSSNLTEFDLYLDFSLKTKNLIKHKKQGLSRCFF